MESHLGTDLWTIPAILSTIVLAIPLLSFLLVSMLNSHQTRWVAPLSTSLMLVATLLATMLLVQVWPAHSFHSTIEWFTLSGKQPISIGVWLTLESAAMLVVVMIISTLVHYYSTVYMKGDEGYKRYYAFLGLFTFSMIGIVLADNLLIVFMFWELVGLSSYLLIGHWYKKDSATLAANKAFIVNRIGDAGFIVGIGVLWTQLGTLDITSLSSLIGQSTLADGQWIIGEHRIASGWLTAAGIGLFMGAVGKSAQFPLQVWLPDAMEGPTPVSALIHAATMVAAGVYLMIRVFVILDPDTLTVIATIGSVTAFMGAVAALTQYDIKKVLAYSTISQLGYMLMGIGVGAYDAAYFHLFTHAFFKACLFLSAGSVIYALHQVEHKNGNAFDVQDMRNMGGLRHKLPVTFVAYVVASLALMGMPFFSGFLSKDALLTGALGWAQSMTDSGFFFAYSVPLLAFITVILTAFYMTRQLMMVFLGNSRIARIGSMVSESPLAIRISLIVLAVLSLGIVWSVNPFDFTSSWLLSVVNTPASAIDQLGDSKPHAEGLGHIMISVLSFVLVLIGIGIGYYATKRTRPEAVTEETEQPVKGMLRRLSYYNWHLDTIYYTTIQRPVLGIAQWAARLERSVIDRLIDYFGVFNVILAHAVSWFDRFIVDGAVGLTVYFTGRLGKVTKSFQGGRVQNYMVIAILGLLLIIYWII